MKEEKEYNIRAHTNVGGCINVHCDCRHFSCRGTCPFHQPNFDKEEPETPLLSFTKC